MPINRNNNKVGKAFAIGTKIEYNGKLYEVIESNSCVDCSIASICSSSNISGGIDIGSTLFRDKRINIFGECSSLKRPDTKSVVFVEVPKDDSKDNSKDEYYKISPLWVDNNAAKLKPVEFDLPNGYMIDKDHSDLDKGIIRFKSKWLTIEQLYKLAKESNHITHRDSIKYFSDSKLVALANLMDIARYFNGDWKFDSEKDTHGYAITFYYNTTEYPQYNVVAINSTSDIYYGNPVFKNEDDAKYVINNPMFRTVLDKIFKV